MKDQRNGTYAGFNMNASDPGTQDRGCYIGPTGAGCAVSGQVYAVDPAVWTLGLGYTAVSMICRVHVLLAAQIQVSIALHTLNSFLILQNSQKTHNIRPRNMTSRRGGREEHADVGKGGQKEKARPSEIEGSLFKARRKGVVALKGRRGDYCTSRVVSDHAPAITEVSAIKWR